MKNKAAQPAGISCVIKRLPPQLPQAKNGVIDISQLPSDDMKIWIRIERWEPVVTGDTFTVYLNSTSSQPRVVDDTSQPSYEAPIPASEIPNGFYLAWDTVTDPAGNCTSSLPIPVTIINSKSTDLQSPLFPDAIDNAVSYTSVTNNQGTPIRAQYETIEEGDKVIFHWKGFDSEGYSVPSADYTSDPLPVESPDKKKGFIDGLVPSDNILTLGDLGIGVAYYEVQPALGEKQTSLNSQVVISWSAIKEMQITVTDGAPVPHSDYVHWKAYNYATLFGSPGTPITASVSKGAGILEADGKTEYKTVLDQDGLAQFRISSENSLIAVSAYAESTPGTPATKSVTFYKDLIAGNDVVQGYNYTTNVPSDNATPCLVYALVDPKLKANALKVSVTGNALISGFFNPSTNHPLNSDGTATIEIFDATPETVHVTLSVPDHPDDPPVEFDIDFIQFPPTS